MRGLSLMMLLWAGCSGGTYVVVSVDSGAALSGIEALGVDLSLGGRMAHKRIQPKSGITLPTDFAVEISSGSGELSVHVDALGANDAVLSSGDGSITVSAHKSVPLRITLGGAAPDLLGAGDGGDGGGGDLSGPAFLTANPTSFSLDPTAATVTHSRHVTITNSGGMTTGALVANLSDAAITAIGLNACDARGLGGGESCDVEVLITPPSPGTYDSELSVHDNSGHEVKIPIHVVSVLGKRLTVVKAGNGVGTVTATDLNCGGACTFLYPPGTVITLTEAPDVSSNFGGWSTACANNTTCDVTLTDDVSLTATFTLKPIQVGLTVTGTGTVNSTPSGINGCTASGGTCSGTFFYGQDLTLAASPGPTTYLTSWAGPSCTGGNCTFKPTADTTLKVNFDPKPANFVFVTSTMTKPGSFGGLAGANTICTNRARAGGLGGNYVAWLSSSTVNAKTALTGSNGWVRRDGKPFANQLTNLLGGEILYPVTLDENGATPNKFGSSPVTNTNPDGTFKYNLPENNCGTMGVAGSDWTVDANVNGVTAGLLGGSTEEWTNRYGQNCNTPSSLICFGTGQSVVLTVPTRPAGARLMFPLATAAFDPATMRSMADSQCGMAATNAGFAGTFLAYLTPDDTHPPWTRFMAGGAWYRPDNVQVVATSADFLTNSAVLMATPNVFADKTFPGFALTVLTGRPVAGTNPAETCNNWMLNDSTVYAGAWDLSDLFSGFFISNSCVSAHVLCVQN